MISSLIGRWCCWAQCTSAVLGGWMSTEYFCQKERAVKKFFASFVTVFKGGSFQNWRAARPCFLQDIQRMINTHLDRIMTISKSKGVFVLFSGQGRYFLQNLLRTIHICRLVQANDVEEIKLFIRWVPSLLVLVPWELMRATVMTRIWSTSLLVDNNN